MSQRADIFNFFCHPIMQTQLSLSDRAYLMCDLYSDLGYDDYMTTDETGKHYIYDTQKAYDDLKRSDENEVCSMHDENFEENIRKKLRGDE